MTNIYFIILSYKSEKGKVEKIIQALKPYAVVVVKNDDTKITVEETRITVIQNKTNLGYGSGMNVGIRYARGKNAKWVVLLNDDISLTKNTLSHFISIIQKTDSSIVGPYAGMFDRKRFSTILKTNPKIPIKNPDYISGSFLAIRASVFSAIGLFYDPYFLYYEDADFCYRARKKGFRLEHCILPDLYHKDATRLGQNSILHQYYLARNHLLFVKQLAPLSVKLHEIVRLPKTIIEHKQKNESGAILGIGDFVFGKFGPKEFHI